MIGYVVRNTNISGPAADDGDDDELTTAAAARV